MEQTPLTDWHRRHQAKLMEFGGYEMPVEYTGIIEEHVTVRTGVGMFDVSHMAEFEVQGPDSAKFLDYLVTNQPSQLDLHQALYTPMCLESGGTVDDLLIYRLAEDKFLLVVNAGNYPKDWQWVLEHARGFSGIQIRDVASHTGLIAVQGPKAMAVLSTLTDFPLHVIEYYHAAPDVQVAGVPVYLSRTGYTGEDGFELYVKADETEALWEAIWRQGAVPIGLGARDTLRLEARLPLYGHELSAEITPLEAGLNPFVRLAGKENFLGKEALVQQKSLGIRRKIVGLEVTGGIARAGYPVVTVEGQEPAGYITSGSYSPTLKKSIALALLPVDMAKLGSTWEVLVRGRAMSATVVRTPFYRRSQL
ncbi:MAG: glycine cleavage system aminomethyltransferase GcvT [Gemmataceae bacterium]